MISHKLKLIYIHPPKTGGTSIERELEPYCEMNIPGKHVALLEIQKNFYIFEKYRKKSLAQIKQYRSYFDEYLKVCSIRDPWSRMYSLYKFHNYKRFKNKKISMDSPDDFSDFLHSIIKLNKRRGPKHVTPCYDFGLIMDEEVLKNGVDIFLNQASLQEDFNKLCDKLGISKSILSNKNKTSKGSNLKDIYNSSSEKLVDIFFKRDIEFFNFKKPF